MLMMLGASDSAWAQQALPYSYGFEESAIATSGWTKTTCHANSENYQLGSSDAHSGTYAFRFYYNSTPPQYIISPELEMTANTLSVSFWYKAQSSTYEESFKFGYSSTDNDVASFTWEDEVKTKSTAWTEYTTTCPAGTKYVSIQYTANDKYYLFVDDILIKENVPYSMSISGSDVVGNTIPFGTVRNTTTTKTFTINNDGSNALANVSVVSSDASEFTVSDTGFDIAAGATKDITVTFVKGVEGDYSRTITISQANIATPIVLTASSTYTENWGEDFESGAIPTGWDNSGFVVKKDNIGNYPVYNLPTNFAVGNGGNNEKTLITPLLKANAGDKFTFDGFFYYGDETMKVDYSTDRSEWHNLYTYDKSSYTSGSTHNIEIESAITGEFYLRFTVNYFNGIDNLSGFKLAPAKEHDAMITAQSIPATGNEGVEYTATVTVKEMAGKAEELTAKFFIGSTQYGDDVVETVDANGTKTFTVTFTPAGAISGDAHFTVTNSNIDLTSDNVAVAIAAAPVLDEAVGSLAGFENMGSYPVLKLTYSLKAGWNTIILPFAVNDLSVFGANAKAYDFTNYSESALVFSKVTSLVAQTPYVIYSDEAKSTITFTGVTGFRTSEDAADLRTTKNGVTFQGTYAPIAAGNWPDGAYGVTTAGKIAPGSTATSFMKGFRAYFTGVTADARLSFEDDATGITTIIDAKELNNDGKVFNLNGQRIENAHKGLYIVNGRKVVVK